MTLAKSELGHQVKIWILEIGEPLPLEGEVRLHRYGQFSQVLAQQGHQVTWWTSSFSHAPKKHFADQDQDFHFNGVCVRVLRGLGYERNVSFARIRHNRHFARRFAELAPRYPKPDLILAPIPIIESARAAVEFALANDIAVLTDIRDLWPDELRDRAPKGLRWLAQLMLTRAYLSMKFVCKNATGIMAISQSYMQYGLRFAGRPRGPNDLFFPLGYTKPQLSEAKMIEARSWCQGLLQRAGAGPNSLVICFFGTIGEFFDLDTVIAAARELSSVAARKPSSVAARKPSSVAAQSADSDGAPEFVFLLAGDGRRLNEFRAKARNLANVIFTGWIRAAQIQAVMEASHVGLAPYARGAKMALPNKPFEYMSGGLAVLSSIATEMPDLLREHHCGRSYPADSVPELVSHLRWLRDHPGERRKMGEAGYQLWQAQFDSSKVALRVTGELARIARSPAGFKQPNEPAWTGPQ